MIILNTKNLLQEVYKQYSQGNISEFSGNFNHSFVSVVVNDDVKSAFLMGDDKNEQFTSIPLNCINIENIPVGTYFFRNSIEVEKTTIDTKLNIAKLQMTKNKHQKISINHKSYEERLFWHCKNLVKRFASQIKILKLEIKLDKIGLQPKNPIFPIRGNLVLINKHYQLLNLQKAFNDAVSILKSLKNKDKDYLLIFEQNPEIFQFYTDNLFLMYEISKKDGSIEVRFTRVNLEGLNEFIIFHSDDDNPIVLNKHNIGNENYKVLKLLKQKFSEISIENKANVLTLDSCVFEEIQMLPFGD